MLNATLGWSWADPIAGLIIAAVAVTEGREAWRGEGCCGPLGAGHTDPADDHECGCPDEACTDGCCTLASAADPETEVFQIRGHDAGEQ